MAGGARSVRDRSAIEAQAKDCEYRTQDSQSSRGAEVQADGYASRKRRTCTPT